jgi:flagellar basal-body rod protein FlgB
LPLLPRKLIEIMGMDPILVLAWHLLMPVTASRQSGKRCGANMLSKIDNEIAFVQSALNLRARRQEILAANIANSDTPNYKARDLDFSAALANVMGAAGGPLPLATTSSRHLQIAGYDAGVSAGHLKYRSSLQPSLDGNTVDADVERAHFAENALHYQFLLDRASSDIRTYKQALEPAR